MSNTYKSAGVDKEEGYKTVDKIKTAVAETHNKNVLNNLGSFGAFYQIAGYKNPVLVSGTDGVGTKLKVALDSKKYDSIGVDCFAMCANDILCHGAKPLFFLDYLACGKLDSEIAAEIVMGMVNACKDNECALIGGERLRAGRNAGEVDAGSLHAGRVLLSGGGGCAGGAAGESGRAGDAACPPGLLRRRDAGRCFPADCGGGASSRDESRCGRGTRGAFPVVRRDDIRRSAWRGCVGAVGA